MAKTIRPVMDLPAHITYLLDQGKTFEEIADENEITDAEAGGRLRANELQAWYEDKDRSEMVRGEFQKAVIKQARGRGYRSEHSTYTHGHPGVGVGDLLVSLLVQSLSSCHIWGQQPAAYRDKFLDHSAA